jgi:hypothetical protein
MGCPVCTLYANDGISLANGEVVHKKCFDELLSSIASAEREYKFQYDILLSVKNGFQRKNTYLNKFMRLFGAGVDIEEIQSQIRKVEDILLIRKSTLTKVQSSATPIFDLMLDYPPDWDERVNAVLARDKVCTKCGHSQNPHAHHIVPLSRGGTNKLENITLLCERCHQSIHGVSNFSPHVDEPLPIAKRVQIINNAIRNGSVIEFLYRKPNDNSYNKRTIIPIEIIEVPHNVDAGNTLCVRGHCQLRNEKRTFALKRMKGLKER